MRWAGLFSALRLTILSYIMSFLFAFKRRHAFSILLLSLGTILTFSACSKKDPGSREVATLTVPEGFTIEEAVPSDMLSYPMFASFDDRGRLFVFESTGPNTMGTELMSTQPSYHIRLLEDEDDDGVFDKSSIFADRS